MSAFDPLRTFTDSKRCSVYAITMRMFLTYLTAPLLVLGCAPHIASNAAQSAPQVNRVQHQGIEYRQLTGARLRQAIVGSTVTSLDVVTSGGQGTFFGADGRTFWWRGEMHILSGGTYQVHDDLVLTTTPYVQSYFELFESDKGDFLRVNPPPYISPERILISRGTPPIPNMSP